MFNIVSQLSLILPKVVSHFVRTVKSSFVHTFNIILNGFK